MIRRALTLAATLLVLACSGAGGSRESAQRHGAEPALALFFAALWWSEAQMEGLDPDAPPAKRTPVRLERWGGGDPVGDPSPETFDVVANLTGLGDDGDHYVDLLQRWGVGPLHGDGPAGWTDWELVVRFGPLEPEAKAGAEIRLATIDLAGQQSALFADERWPWVFEARVALVRGVSSEASIAEATHQLPIQPGD